MKEIVHTRLEDMHSNMWGFHFKVPEKVLEQFSDGTNRRVICSINQKERMHCAIMPSPEGPFILINKTLIKKLGLVAGEEVVLELEKDTSEYGMPVTEEFELVIFGDEEAAHFFEALTPGKKRNLLHLVNKIKSSDIRINRSMAIAHHLKESKGKIDFKGLNETIKMYNQRNKIN